MDCLSEVNFSWSGMSIKAASTCCSARSGFPVLYFSFACSYIRLPLTSSPRSARSVVRREFKNLVVITSCIITGREDISFVLYGVRALVRKLLIFLCLFEIAGASFSSFSGWRHSCCCLTSSSFDSSARKRQIRMSVWLRWSLLTSAASVTVTSPRRRHRPGNCLFQRSQLVQHRERRDSLVHSLLQWVNALPVMVIANAVDMSGDVSLLFVLAVCLRNHYLVWH